MTTTREDLDKRYPPRTRFRIPDHARGMDATEFAARFGELRARVDVDNDQRSSRTEPTGDQKSEGVER